MHAPGLRYGILFVYLPTQGAVATVLDSLEEITCLTECLGGEEEFLEHMLTDAKLHMLLNVSYMYNHTRMCTV